MNKPVVLIIDNSVGVTGAIKSITQSCFDNRDYFDFQFVIPPNSNARSIIQNKGFSKIYELPMRELKRSIFSVFVYLPFLLINAIRLNRIAKKNEVALIHVNDVYNLLPVAMRLLGGSKPYVCHIRFLPNRFPVWIFNFWYRCHLRYSRQMIAVSNTTKSMLPPKSAIVVYDNLPQEKYTEVQVDEEKPPRIFLYISNFTQAKGQDHAIEAFSKVHSELPEWKLRFVGSVLGGLSKNKTYKNKLEERAKELGLHKKIEWLAFTEDVELEYKRADIVLNFSESESFSMTCLEALFYGRPLIATNCGGPAEIIANGTTGLLVENKDVKSMAFAMKQLAVDEGLRRDFGKQARMDVRKRFGKENTSMQIKSIYDSIIRP